MNQSNKKNLNASDVTLPGFFSIATAAALTTVLLWGGSSMVTKLGTQSMDGVSLGVLRVIAAGPCALVIIGIMRLRIPWHYGSRIHFCVISIMATLGTIIFTLGVQYTTAGHAVVASSATAIFTGLIEAGFRRQWPSSRWWTGITVGFFGALILISESLGLGISQATWYGDLLCMLGAFCGSFGFYLGGRMSIIYGAKTVSLWRVVFACMLLIPALIISVPSEEISEISLLGWGVIFYLAAGASVIASMTWLYALSRGGIGRMAVWQFALPIVGVTLAWIVLKEPITFLLLASIAVILIGIALVQAEKPDLNVLNGTKKR